MLTQNSIFKFKVQIKSIKTGCNNWTGRRSELTPIVGSSSTGRISELTTSGVIVNRQQTSNSVSETQMLLFWLISKLTLSSVSTTRHLMRDVYVIINCVHFLICVIVFNSVCVTHGSLISKLQLSFMLLYINVTHYCIKSNMYNYCTLLWRDLLSTNIKHIRKSVVGCTYL